MASYCMASYGGACCCIPKKTKKNLKVLVGVTASVATIKLAELVDLLYSLPSVDTVAVVPTEKSEKFFNAEEVTSIGPRYEKEDVKIWRDEDEWAMWNGRGDPVLHIDLGKWADAMILAPLDANTLAKIAHGLCDNLLTCVLRAWDLKNIRQKPVFFCPAMNTKMWEHPVTSEQIGILEGFGYTCVAPIEKTLMCGDTGIGAMASVETIVNTFGNYMNEMCTCAGNSSSDSKGRGSMEAQYGSDSQCSSKRHSSLSPGRSPECGNSRRNSASYGYDYRPVHYNREGYWDQQLEDVDENSMPKYTGYNNSDECIEYPHNQRRNSQQNGKGQGPRGNFQRDKDHKVGHSHRKADEAAADSNKTNQQQRTSNPDALFQHYPATEKEKESKPATNGKLVDAENKNKADEEEAKSIATMKGQSVQNNDHQDHANMSEYGSYRNSDEESLNSLIAAKKPTEIDNSEVSMADFEKNIKPSGTSSRKNSGEKASSEPASTETKAQVATNSKSKPIPAYGNGKGYSTTASTKANSAPSSKINGKGGSTVSNKPASESSSKHSKKPAKTGPTSTVSSKTNENETQDYSSAASSKANAKIKSPKTPPPSTVSSQTDESKSKPVSTFHSSDFPHSTFASGSKFPSEVESQDSKKRSKPSYDIKDSNLSKSATKTILPVSNSDSQFADISSQSSNVNDVRKQKSDPVNKENMSKTQSYRNSEEDDGVSMISKITTSLVHTNPNNIVDSSDVNMSEFEENVKPSATSTKLKSNTDTKK